MTQSLTTNRHVPRKFLRGSRLQENKKFCWTKSIHPYSPTGVFYPEDTPFGTCLTTNFGRVNPISVILNKTLIHISYFFSESEIIYIRVCGLSCLLKLICNSYFYTRIKPDDFLMIMTLLRVRIFFVFF
jgi:hypothetical protein